MMSTLSVLAFLVMSTAVIGCGSDCKKDEGRLIEDLKMIVLHPDKKGGGTHDPWSGGRGPGVEKRIFFVVNSKCDTLTRAMEEKLDSFACNFVGPDRAQEYRLINIRFYRKTDYLEEMDSVLYGITDANNPRMIKTADTYAQYLWREGKFYRKRVGSSFVLPPVCMMDLEDV